MAKQYISETYSNKFYYKDPAKTILHREDGPAVEYSDGDKAWYQNDVRHRLDGPAFENANGFKMWYVNGIFIFAIDEEGNIVNRMK